MKQDLNICLNYHDFSGTAERSPHNSKYTIEFSYFKEQLAIMEEFNNRPFTYFAEKENSGIMTYCLTFDDGYKSNLYVAEEMNKRGIKGMFFIITDTCKQKNGYLNISEIREIHKMGMEIGSHSCSHRHLSTLSMEEMKRELTESKAFLEDILSVEVKSFAFPGGRFGAREIRSATQAGYDLKRTCLSGINQKPLSNGIVKIVTVTKGINIETFRDILEMSPYFLARVKLREVVLAVPKYIHFEILNGN
jgi:peptidoglycan/xylan/chitin deacetylase (PgdA/CDA1 family)